MDATSKTANRLLVALLPVIFIPAVLILVGVVQSARTYPFESDFAAYYALGRLVLDQGFNHLYDLDAQRRHFDALGPLPWYPSMQGPPLVMLVIPFSLLPFKLAYPAWIFLLLASIALTWLLLVEGSPLQRIVQLGLWLAFLPIGPALFHGQADLLVPVIAAVCWWLLRKDRQVAAGLVLSLIAIKPQLAILVPLALAASGRWRTFAAWAGASALIGAISLLLVGPAGLLDYAARLLMASSGANAPWLVRTDLTLAGLLGGATAGWLARLALIGLTLAIAYRRRAEGPEVILAAGLLGSLLTTPFIHAPDLTLLIPIGWLYLRSRPPVWQQVGMVAGYLAAQLAMAPAVGGTPLLLLEIALLASMLLPGHAAWVGRKPARLATLGVDR